VTRRGEVVTKERECGYKGGEDVVTKVKEVVTKERGCGDKGEKMW
jgi:hypothetical protein